MTTTPSRLRTYWADRQLDKDRISSLAIRHWEIVVFGALIAVALSLRLWDLGGRSIHHDESIHMWYSWLLAEGRGYTHDPTYHGPFEIFGTAAIFKVFGDSDFTGRLFPALFGTALVALPFFMRGMLGRTGAIIAAGLLALSPSLLYFSRFARNDIYIAVYTLGMVILMWRYMKDQKEAYLYGVPLLLMLGFVTKEVTFMTTAIFLVYLDYRLTTDLVDQIRASRTLRPLDSAILHVVLLPFAWLIAALWPLLESPRKRWSLSSLPPAGHLLIIMGTFALPQFAPAIQKLPEFVDSIPAIGGALVSGLNLDVLADQGFRVSDERTLMQVTVILTLVATAYVGLLWNPKVWAIGAALFYIPFVLFFTTGFTNMGGFWSGIWDSLDYWLGQQLVRRGNQPDYYYFILLPVYEFLPLVFAVGGTLYYAFKGKLEQQLLALSALLLVIVFSLAGDGLPVIGSYYIHLSFVVVIGTVLILEMEGFTKFLLFWMLAILFGVTIAGEKMPWLTVHLAVPGAILAAKVLDDVLSSVGDRRPGAEGEGPKARPRARGAPPADAQSAFPFDRVAPLVYGGVLALGAVIVFQAVGPASALSVLAWLLAAGALGVVIWSARSVSWQTAGQVVVVSAFAALSVFTIRTTGTAAFDEGSPDGTPPELLIYAQGSPTLSPIRDEIDRLAEGSGQGNDLSIVLDNSENIWPWPWYLRNYNNIQYTNLEGDFTPEGGSVLLLTDDNQASVQPFQDQFRAGIPYTHMWWFPEVYRNLDVDNFIGDVFTGDLFPTWRSYLIDRTVPTNAPSPDRVAFFPKSFEPIAPALTEGQYTIQSLDDSTVIGALGSEPGQFSQPADVAVDAEGNLYVVDTLNRRIQRLTLDGDATVFGQAGGGPGQFGAVEEPQDGPWGITIDADGNIYVADTWNHRVQKFGPDLEFILEWGGPFFGEGDPGEAEFFGPRDIAIDAEGNVLVVDTGNKRIVKYDPNGEFLDSYGKEGDGEGEFNEPSSVAVAPNGDVYVADYWNQRIQHFDADFDYIDEVAIESWGSQGVTDRAYLAVLDDGRILASDPANAQVLVVDVSSGDLTAFQLGGLGLSRPVGVAVDGQGQVYVSDSLSSQIRQIPLETLLGE